jgi:hypothetical protein
VNVDNVKAFLRTLNFDVLEVRKRSCALVGQSLGFGGYSAGI